MRAPALLCRAALGLAAVAAAAPAVAQTPPAALPDRRARVERAAG